MILSNIWIYNDVRNETIKLSVNVWKVHNSLAHIPNQERAQSLCYLRGLPDTSAEIGNKNRIVTW